MQETSGRFFDGRTAAQHSVSVVLSANQQALEIHGATLSEPLVWPLSDLRAAQDDTGHAALLTLTLHANTEDERPRDPARLILEDALAIAWVRKTRPNLYRRDTPSGTLKKIGRNLVLAVGAVALMLFVILPAMADTLARFIPVHREVALGKTVVGQMETMLGSSGIGALVCRDPKGQDALREMVARLTAHQDLPYPLEVVVFDHGMVNAFAAPGGQIVLLRGLLEDASGPDVVAGVLAHEIGHVVNRDPTRAALRGIGSAGLLSLLIGDVTGGTGMVFLGEQLLSTSYSRGAERDADLRALEILQKADISADGFAQFFDGLQNHTGGLDLPQYLQTHPDLGERSKSAYEVAQMQSNTRPVLDEAQWAALRGICAVTDPATPEE